MQIKVDNIKRIFAVELIFAFIYTYVGHMLTLFLMRNGKDYKEIAVMCLPLSLLTIIISHFTNMAIMNLIVISFYFFYCYIKSQKIQTLVRSFEWLVLIFIIQTIFYFFKYYIFKIPYSSIDSDVTKSLMSFDYYIFLAIIIIIRDKLTKR